MFIFSSIRSRLDDVEFGVSETKDNGELISSFSEIREMLHIISGKIDKSNHEIKQVVGLSTNSKDVEKEESLEIRRNEDGKGHEIPVIVFTYQRSEYLKRAVDKVLKVIPKYGRSTFPVYISQDGNHGGVKEVARSYGSKIAGHFMKEHTARFETPMKGPKAYYYISQHYEFGLKKVFTENPHYNSIIILEEDLEVSADFFEYMDAMDRLLDEDHSLFCASAFNDNGLPEHVDNPMSLFRSDFFPGLGWLLPRRIWEEFDEKGWPIGFWDDWIRLPENRKGRACIRPEISRTFTFGEKGGASKGQFSNFLNNILLDKVPINWDKIDLGFLKKENYDVWMNQIIASCEEININNIDNYKNQKKNLKIVYNSKQSFIKIAKKCHVMSDEKSNVPRGSYKGVVPFKYQSNNIFLVPSRPDLLYNNNN